MQYLPPFSKVFFGPLAFIVIGKQKRERKYGERERIGDELHQAVLRLAIDPV